MKVYLPLIFIFSLLPSCFPGGIVEKGGFSQSPGYLPSVVNTRGAPYRYVCKDKRTGEIELIERDQYKFDCPVEGETSIFVLLHMFPVTEPMNPEYAAAMAIQSVEGDGLVRAVTWSEVHYYSVLGKAEVWKIKGHVIRYLSAQEIEDQKPKKVQPPARRRTR